MCGKQSRFVIARSPELVEGRQSNLSVFHSNNDEIAASSSFAKALEDFSR